MKKRNHLVEEDEYPGRRHLGFTDPQVGAHRDCFVFVSNVCCELSGAIRANLKKRGLRKLGTTTKVLKLNCDTEKFQKT